MQEIVQFSESSTYTNGRLLSCPTASKISPPSRFDRFLFFPTENNVITRFFFFGKQIKNDPFLLPQQNEYKNRAPYRYGLLRQRSVFRIKLQWPKHALMVKKKEL
jgi:hypothetical protein